jgi:ATP-dependent exoDNAse (exonuclease V) beta subunit
MIDEFQDTSALQWDNFLPLIQENESYNRDNLIVGDVKQSIYRFRNSDWSLLKNIPNLFAKSNIVKMQKN